MPVEIKKTTTTDVVARTEQPVNQGGLRVTVRLVDDQKIGWLDLAFYGEEGPQRVTIEAVDVERAAELLDRLREELNDFRSVCLEHGYYRGSCDGCVKPALPEEEPVIPAPPPSL